MWRDRDRYPEHNLVPDTFWLVIGVLLFAACGLVWLIGQIAAILFGAHEHLPVRLVDKLGGALDYVRSGLRSGVVLRRQLAMRLPGVRLGQAGGHECALVRERDHLLPGRRHLPGRRW